MCVLGTACLVKTRAMVLELMEYKNTSKHPNAFVKITSLYELYSVNQEDIATCNAAGSFSE